MFFFLEEAEQFNEEWKTIAHGMQGRARIEMPRIQYHSSTGAAGALALTAGPSHHQDVERSPRRHSNHAQG